MNPLLSKVRVMCLVAVSLLAVSAMAQNSGSIQGTVTDAAGAVIAGATVQAVDSDKGVVVRDATTSAEGLFVLQPLQPGTYTVRVQATGMKKLERNKIVLDSRQSLSLGELKVDVGSTTESITVEAQTPLVETATADHTDVIDSKLVTETSLNGRDFQSLVRTLPGVVSNDSNDFRLAFNNTNAFHVNGLRGSDNNFFLDGSVNTDVGANDGQYTQLSMDAIGEFKIQSNNFAAEYGRNPGVLLAVNTKAGTKQFHGTLYEFHREDAFDASPPFGNGVKNYIRFNQYGGNIGGPIPLPHYKNKLFFFFNYEGTRGIQPGNTQFNSQVISGLGRGYELPNPAILNVTPAGLDLTALYTGVCDPATRTNCAGLTDFNNGQVFLPGSTHFTTLVASSTPEHRFAEPPPAPATSFRLRWSVPRRLPSQTISAKATSPMRFRTQVRSIRPPVWPPNSLTHLTSDTTSRNIKKWHASTGTLTPRPISFSAGSMTLSRSSITTCLISPTTRFFPSSAKSRARAGRGTW